MSGTNDDIKNIREANQEILDYFTSSYDTIADNIATLKSELFEINVKLDELYKTKSLYNFNSNTRKNVFTPVLLETAENSKEAAIKSQIEDLLVIKDTLETKILDQEIDFKSVKNKVRLLKKALISVDSLETDISDLEAELEELGANDLQILEDNEDDKFEHGNNILMLDAFDKTFVSTLLDKRVKDEIQNNRRKLETLGYMITSNPSQAKIMASDISGNLSTINYTIDTILKQNGYFIETDKPVYYLLDNFVTDIRDHHPELVVEANIRCANHDKTISYIKSISLLSLMNIFMDNIYKHANANHIIIDVAITDKELTVKINDNGIGIPSDYSDLSPWYSGLHKAHETIFLLNGSLSIAPDVNKGTNVEFSFSIL